MAQFFSLSKMYGDTSDAEQRHLEQQVRRRANAGMASVIHCSRAPRIHFFCIITRCRITKANRQFHSRVVYISVDSSSLHAITEEAVRSVKFTDQNHVLTASK